MIDRSALANAQQDAAFSDESWLTFYLSGSPDQHETMKAGLLELGAINLAGGEYGFVYAKVPVSLSEVEIEKRIEQVRDLAAEADVVIDLIDLDASADVERSKFYTLWQAPPV
jgi:hypothetical protein